MSGNTERRHFVHQEEISGVEWIKVPFEDEGEFLFSYELDGDGKPISIMIWAKNGDEELIGKSTITGLGEENLLLKSDNLTQVEDDTSDIKWRLNYIEKRSKWIIGILVGLNVLTLLVLWFISHRLWRLKPLYEHFMQ